MDYKETIERLLAEIETLKETNKKVLKRVAYLEQENLQLRNRVVELEGKLEKYENPKNSNNSSIPPSQDPNRETRSLRKKSAKKIGGQPGRKRYKLNKVENPDEAIVHDITKCECCDAELPKEGEIKSRQIFDIPKIKIRVTEHRIVMKTCSKCGEKNKSNFPDGLVQEAQYGNQIKATRML